MSNLDAKDNAHRYLHSAAVLGTRAGVHAARARLGAWLLMQGARMRPHDLPCVLCGRGPAKVCGPADADRRLPLCSQCFSALMRVGRNGAFGSAAAEIEAAERALGGTGE